MIKAYSSKVKEILKSENNGTEDEEEEGKIWWYEGFAVLSLCSTCISCGTFLGYTSSAVPSMQEDETLESLQDYDVALIGGLGPFGSLLGSLFSVFSLNYLGSRRTIGLLGLPALLASWITIGLSRKILQIMIGRFLGGIGVGAIIASAPLYVMDISSTLRRGKMGIMPQLLMISGILIVYILGGFLKWNNLALISIIFTILGGCLLIFAPDTPKWLISKGKVDTAFAVLKRLQGHQTAQELCKDLQHKLKQDIDRLTNKQSIFTSIGKTGSAKPILVCLGIISIQQLTGINGVTFFAATIFNQSSSATSNTANISSIILASTQLMASFLATFFVERFGRTFLLKVSSLTITVSATILGFYFYFMDSLNTNMSWIPLATLIIFAFGFSIGLGPVTWILVVELLPISIKQLVNPLIIAYNWLCVCIVTTSFPWLKESISLFGIFWLYAAIAFVGLVFVFLFVPETKGKSSEEIQQQFTKKDGGNMEQNTPSPIFVLTLSPNDLKQVIVI